jgi:hypothetical protein
MARSTVILLDDGSNSGETLMGLLDAAIAGQPSFILAYVGITRMPPHKAHLLRNLSKLTDISKGLTVRFAVGLGIPVYRPRTCPVCKFHDDLNRIEEHSLLRRYASKMKEETKSVNTYLLLDHIETDQSTKKFDYTQDSEVAGRLDAFLWHCTASIQVFKLREAVELLDYHIKSSDYIDAVLKQASSGIDDPRTKEAILDLGFVLCLEPELAAASVFMPYLNNLRDNAIAYIRGCDEKEVMTFVGLVFHLMVEQLKSGSIDYEEATCSIWEVFLKRDPLNTQLLGRIITFALAEALSEQGKESEPHKNGLCQIWLIKLRSLINEQIDERKTFAEAFAPLFIRDALAAFRGVKPSYLSPSTTDETTSLYEIADDCAKMFWRHSSDYIKFHIDTLAQKVKEHHEQVPDDIYAPIRALVLAFDVLHNLQDRLRQVEFQCEKRGEKPGLSDYWNIPEFDNAVTSFVQVLANLAELIENSNLSWDHQAFLTLVEALPKAWDELDHWLGPAFEVLFPEIEVVTSRWSEYSEWSRLNGSIKEPLQGYIDPYLLKAGRVFIPRSLLWKFIGITMQNLETSAFNSWTDEEIIRDGKAHVEISSERDIEGNAIISVRVVDNGKKHRRQAAESGSNQGLNDVDLVARHFEAVLIRPSERGEDETVIELQMRHRITTGDQAHV